VPSPPEPRRVSSSRRRACIAFITFLRRHLANDEAASSDLVVHCLLPDGLLCFVAFSP